MLIGTLPGWQLFPVPELLPGTEISHIIDEDRIDASECSCESLTDDKAVCRGSYSFIENSLLICARNIKLGGEFRSA